MSKLSSSERFFIDMIALGMEAKSLAISQEDIQQLLSTKANYDKSFMNSCVSYLNYVYTSPGFPKELVYPQVKKLYSGRESLLREAVLKWYKGVASPSLLQKLKDLIKK